MLGDIIDSRTIRKELKDVVVVYHLAAKVTTPFANIDATYAATAPAQAYRADEFGGVFTTNRWYKYNITGTDNQIWPTFNVYLIKKGSSIYKVQLTGYYGANGAARQITLRYRKIQ